MHPDDIKQLIQSHIPCTHIEVTGEDRRHYTALVVSDAFTGLLKIKRHRLVYQALGTHMESDIHALSIQTLTPEEYQG